MPEIKFETGLLTYEVNGGRTIQFNPADQGFIETVYNLAAKLSSIYEERDKKVKETEEFSERFDISREAESEARSAVDAVFGDGFCKDVFPCRLDGMSCGLTIVENFLFALMDEMDENVTKNLAERDERLKKYTAKYDKYRKFKK